MSKSSPIDDQDKVLMDDLNKKLDDLNSAYSLTMDAKILLMDYIVSLGKEHVIACSQFIQDQVGKSNPEVFIKATQYWHDYYVDISVISGLSEKNKEILRPWSEEEKLDEIK